jgi:hypothetical protein
LETVLPHFGEAEPLEASPDLKAYWPSPALASIAADVGRKIMEGTSPGVRHRPKTTEYRFDFAACLVPICSTSGPPSRPKCAGRSDEAAPHHRWKTGTIFTS